MARPLMRTSPHSGWPCRACCIDGMARWAIGDIQGCADELTALIARIGFRPVRDGIGLVGALVNRGADSPRVLRLVRSLADNALCVLGNHDLHLLAVALVQAKV